MLCKIKHSVHIGNEKDESLDNQFNQLNLFKGQFQIIHRKSKCSQILQDLLGSVCVGLWVCVRACVCVCFGSGSGGSEFNLEPLFPNLAFGPPNEIEITH